MKTISYDRAGNYLARKLPSAAVEIDQIYREYPNQESINLYTYLSEVLHWKVMEAALRDKDDGRLSLCFAIIEELLQRGDAVVVEAVNIRIVPYLLTDAWLRASQMRSGPVLREALDEYAEGQEWRRRVPGPVTPEVGQPQRRTPVVVYSFGSRLAVVAQRQSGDERWFDAAPLVVLDLPIDVTRLGHAIVSVVARARSESPALRVTQQLLDLGGVADRFELERRFEVVFVNVADDAASIWRTSPHQVVTVPLGTPDELGAAVLAQLSQ